MQSWSSQNIVCVLALVQRCTAEICSVGRQRKGWTVLQSRSRPRGLYLQCVLHQEALPIPLAFAAQNFLSSS
jgi:hypothetical protein